MICRYCGKTIRLIDPEDHWSDPEGRMLWFDGSTFFCNEYFVLNDQWHEPLSADEVLADLVALEQELASW